MAHKATMSITGTAGRVEKPLILDAPAPAPEPKPIPKSIKKARKKSNSGKADKI